MKKTGAILIIYNLREQRAEILKVLKIFWKSFKKKTAGRNKEHNQNSGSGDCNTSGSSNCNRKSKNSDSNSDKSLEEFSKKKSRWKWFLKMVFSKMSCWKRRPPTGCSTGGKNFHRDNYFHRWAPLWPCIFNNY